MHPLLNIAFDAVKNARKTILSALENLENLEIQEKAKNDFVTEIDKEVEQIIVDTIHDSYPDHAILGEESGAAGEHEYTWIIDPIDGTSNFIHGHPHFSTSIAIQHKNRIENGLIYDHLRHELFHATRGSGAYLDNKRIRVSKHATLSKSLLGYGFVPRKTEFLPLHLKTVEILLPATTGMRRSGSAALDLAYVASARLDAMWEFGLNKWDIAAGTLMIKEAGGIVCDEAGGETYLEKGNVVAGNSVIIKELIKIIKKNL